MLLRMADMDWQYSPQRRAERLIVTGRLVLAAFSLLAVWLEPFEPARYSALAVSLLSGYVVYAFLLALMIWHIDVTPEPLRVTTHVFDLVAFSVFMFLTEGPISPFFVYLVFFIVCATLRWQWRGALWTAAAALMIFIAMGVYSAKILEDPAFHINRFIIRSVDLAVIATLLGYLGVYEQRLRSELTTLAVWPRTIRYDVRGIARDILEHTAAVFGARRVLMVWEEPGEPWLHVALWSQAEYRYNRESPEEFLPLVTDELKGKDFLCLNTRDPRPPVLYLSPSGFQRWSGPPLNPQLQARFSITSVLSLKLERENLAGRLFILDGATVSSDELLLGRIVAGRAIDILIQFYLLQQLRNLAATEERIRLARDLHDGLLQSLAGMALKLQTVKYVLESDPKEADREIQEIQRLLVAEQRSLRLSIREMRQGAGVSMCDNVSLEARLRELNERVEYHWGLRVSLEITEAEIPFPDALCQDILFIIHEALVNAARHSHASLVRVSLAAEGDFVRITVTDNGRGFPFIGRYDHSELVAKKLGPATLRERISSLGGVLGIDSTEAGSHLQILLPMTRYGVSDVDPSSSG